MKRSWAQPPNRDPRFLLEAARRSIKRLEARPLTSAGLLASLRRMEAVYEADR